MSDNQAFTSPAAQRWLRGIVRRGAGVFWGDERANPVTGRPYVAIPRSAIYDKLFEVKVGRVTLITDTTEVLKGLLNRNFPLNNLVSALMDFDGEEVTEVIFDLVLLVNEDDEQMDVDTVEFHHPLRCVRRRSEEPEWEVRLIK